MIAGVDGGWWEEQDVCFRAGDKIRGRGERGKDLQLAYSLPWLECMKVVKINK